MSLKTKISLLVLGLLTGAIGGLAAVLAWSEGRILADDLARRQTEQAEGLAEVCRNTLFAQQDLFLTNYLKRLKASPEIVEAWCVDGEGMVAGHTDPSQAKKPWGAPLNHADQPAREWKGDTLIVSAPLRLGDNLFGTARIVFAGERVKKRLEEDIAGARRRILGMALPVLAVGVVLAFLLTAMALRPMGTLVAGARAIGAGKLSHVIPVGRRDELGVLAGEFNAMAGKLAELDEMKKDFVNGVTHDLKGPLAAARAAADLAQAQVEKETPAGPFRQALAEKLLVIRDSTERLRNLVTSILEVARIENGLVLEKSPVLLEKAARRAAETYRLPAEGKGLSLNVVLHRDLPTLMADEGKLERALANLAGNAVKFTEKGSVTLELDAEPGFQVVRVRDTGPGIPPDALEKLFSKFFRVRRPGERIEGTGLGLAIAKGIAEAHGGSVTVESAVGKGTVFTLRLPS
jgi:signal transduction histidine kinase